MVVHLLQTFQYFMCFPQSAFFQVHVHINLGESAGEWKKFWRLSGQRGPLTYDLVSHLLAR